MIRPTPVQTVTCPAVGCARRIPMYDTMCGDHWPMVPPDLREEITRRGGAGTALSRAVGAVARAEGRPAPAHVCLADGCRAAVPPGTLMCGPHGDMVPAPPVRAADVSAPAPTAPPVPHTGRPGDLDEVIVRAVRAGRTLTADERDDIEVRHGAVSEPGTADEALTCRSCRYRYTRRSLTCPSVVFLAGGLAAAFAAGPPGAATRRCRTCPAVVAVQPGARGSVQCPACEAQSRIPDLFGDAL